MTDYGQRLELALRAHSRDRADLARELGISVQAVGQVINGSTKMLDALNHVRTCRFLGIDMMWLASGEGSMDGPSRTDREIMKMLMTLPEPEKARVVGYVEARVEEGKKAA